MMEEDSSHESSPVAAALVLEDTTQEVTQKLADTSLADQLQDAAAETAETSLKTDPSREAAKSPPVALTSPAPGTPPPASPTQVVASPVPPPAQIPQFTGNPYSAHRHHTPQQVQTTYPASASAATGTPLFYNPASVASPGAQPQIYMPPAVPQQPAVGAQGVGMPPSPGYSPSPQQSYTPSQQMQQYSPTQTQAAAHAPYGSSSSIDLPLDAGVPYQQQQNYNLETGPGWFGGGIMNKLKNSVETMITVLDPGMKQYIHSGGDVDIIVTSDKEAKVGPVREAFQAVFGKATVTGLGSQANIAAQPVGFTVGVKGAEERIENLRRSGIIDERQTIMSIENFLAEVIPDKWFDIGCIVLKDPLRNINLQVFTQATPIPPEYVQQIQDDTPQDYPLRWSGYSVTIGEMICRYQPHVHRSEWHAALTGVSRQEMIFVAAKTLAGLYKQKLPPMTS
ncbi:protein PRRC1-like isoform X2 [Lineus longissimus]|uniref:protein PRRC1-like isoform X2 n=1 Tax=Lineus longissimus TaxID=88925 RepID=UPI002B4DAB0F